MFPYKNMTFYRLVYNLTEISYISINIIIYFLKWNDMEIRSLSETSFDVLFNAFEQAFADYEIQLDKNQLQTMLKRRGFNTDLSFAAFNGNDIVSFTCNGIGDFNGMFTAYDTGTGTLKDYRGRGLATKIFNHSIPYLKEAGIKRYLLEVLQHNTGAVSVYRKIGFEVSREFNYFQQKNQEVRNEAHYPDLPYSIRLVDINDYDEMPDFWDFEPSWQNSFESIRRSPEDFISLGVFDEENLIGYCVFDPISGDVTQIAVDKNYRRKGVASVLLEEMLKLNKHDSIKVINTDVNCDSITDFLKAKNIDLRGKQFEMIKQI